MSDSLPYHTPEVPQANDAEVLLLGGLLQDAEAIMDITQVLKGDEFYQERHRFIWDAMMELNAINTPIDIVTLSQKLEKNGKIAQVGGKEYLLQLMESVASAANARWHGELIRQKALLRGLITAANEIIRNALDPSAEPAHVLDRAEQKVFELAENQVRDSMRPARVLVETVLQNLDKQRGDALSGCATGFDDLDKLTNGLQPSDLIILAGRPAMGKTAFALSLAANAAINHGKRVAFFSLEMGGEQLAQRVLCSQAQIDQTALRSGRVPASEFHKIPMAAQPIMNSALFIDDQPDLSITQLRSKCRTLKRKDGLDLVIVDYLQLMDTGKEENRAVAIGAVSRGLKILAKELKIPVISLAQLSRKAEDPHRKGRPMLSDLRESGSIEQDADMVWFIHRPWYYNKEEPPKLAQLLVAKHRNGPTEDINLTFIAEYATFYNYTPEDDGGGSFGGGGDFGEY